VNAPAAPSLPPAPAAAASAGAAPGVAAPAAPAAAAPASRAAGAPVAPATASDTPRRHTPADMPGTWPEVLRVFWRHPSPRLLLVLVTLAASARVWVGGVSWGDLAVLAGLLVYWPVQEWLIHVFILHWRPRTVLGRTLDFRVPRKHRAHHRDPFDAELVFIPLHSYAYSVPLVVGLWLGLAPTLALGLTGVTAHLALSLHYEWVHFLVHTRVVPKSWWYKRLWTSHRLHHFKNEHYWFGVSMLSADRLLRTQPEKDRVETSPTARDLHGLGGAAA